MGDFICRNFVQVAAIVVALAQEVDVIAYCHHSMGGGDISQGADVPVPRSPVQAAGIQLGHVELEDIEAGSHVNHVIDRVIGQVIAHAKGVQFTVAYRLLGHHVIAVQERQAAVIQKIPQVVAIHVKARDACAAREFRDDLGRRAG